MYENKKANQLIIILIVLIIVTVSGSIAFFPTTSILVITLTLLLPIFLVNHAIQFDLLLWACFLAYIFVQWIPALESLRFILLFFLMLFSGYLSKGHKLCINSVVAGLGLIALYSMITSLQSYFPIVAFFKSLSLLLLAGFLFFSLPAAPPLASSRNTGDRIRRVYFHFAMLIVVSNAIYYFIMPASSNGYYTGTSFLNGRFRGWFVNPNDFAALLGVFFIPLFLHECIVQKTVLWKTWTAIVFLLTLIELLLTQSRSGILAGAISLCVVLFGGKKRGTRLVILTGLLFSISLIYFQNPMDNILRRFAYRNEIILNGSGRLTYWKDAWNRFLDKPIWGSGLGVSNTEGNDEGIVFSTLGYKKQIDNSYLSILEELGILGSLLMVGLLLIPLWNKCWLAFKLTDHSLQECNIVYGAGVVAGLFNAMFEGWMLSVGSLISLSFWIFASRLIVEKNMQTHRGFNKSLDVSRISS